MIIKQNGSIKNVLFLAFHVIQVGRRLLIELVIYFSRREHWLVALVLLNVDVLALELLDCNNVSHSVSPWFSSLNPDHFVASSDHKLERLTIDAILEPLEGCFRLVSRGIFFGGCEESLLHDFFVHYFRDNLGVFEGDIIALVRLFVCPWCPEHIERCSNAWTLPYI